MGDLAAGQQDLPERDRHRRQRPGAQPFPHPDGDVSLDDTSALIAFGPGKMGLMWSRQVGDATDGFYWSVHTDGAASTTWSARRRRSRPG